MRIAKYNIVALVLAVASLGQALAFMNPFDKIFYDKLYCGDHAEACDCDYDPPPGCTVEELTKICKGCKGDLYIDYRFKGKTTFWQLKDIKGSMLVAEDSDVKELDFKQLKTTGEAIALGGFPKSGDCARSGSSKCIGKAEMLTGSKSSHSSESLEALCPESLEAVYMPKLVGIGSKGSAYGKLIVGKPLKGSNKAPAGAASGRGYFYPGCAGLYKFYAPQLQYVSSSMSIADNEKLFEISLPKLKLMGVDEKYADGSMSIRDNDNLKVVYLPQAQATGSGFKYNGGRNGGGHDSPPVYEVYGNPKLEFIMYKTNKVAFFDFDASQNTHKALVMHGVPSKYDYWGDFLWEKKMGAWAKVDDLKYEKLDLTHKVWDEKFDWLEDKKDEKDEKLEYAWDTKWDWLEDKKEKLEEIKHEIEEKIEEKKEHFEDKKEYKKDDKGHKKGDKEHKKGKDDGKGHD